MPRRRSLTRTLMITTHRRAVTRFAVADVPPLQTPEEVYEKVLAAIYQPWLSPGETPPSPAPTTTLQDIGYASKNSLISLALRLNGAFARWRIDVSGNRGDVKLTSSVLDVFKMVWKKLNDATS